MKISKMDLTLCVCVPLIIFFLTFLANGLEGQDERVRKLEIQSAAFEQHFIDITKSLNGLTSEIHALNVHQRNRLEERLDRKN